MESESLSSHIFSTDAQDSPESPATGEVDDVHRHPAQASFWCYLCSKIVLAEPERPGDNLEMVCSDCHSGFIEAMNTSQTFPDVHRPHHRRRRRGGGSSGHSVESLESVYSNQISQVFQRLGQTSRDNSVIDQGHQSDQEHDVRRVMVQDDLPSHPPITRSYSRRRAGSEIGSEGYDYIESFLGDSDTNNTFSGYGTILGGSDTNITISGHGGYSDASGDVQSFLDGDMFLTHQDDESHVDGDSESGLDTMRLGLYEWDSMDDDDDGEWEAGGEEDENIENREGTGETRGASSAEESSEQADYRWRLRSRRTRWRDIRRHQRIMNIELNLHDYIPDVFQNIGGNSREASLELHDRPFYAGNPGDYLDARGFEQLLQHLAETDNSRRGAPPAAQSVVEQLPLIVIRQAHEEDGSSVCAICKDSLALGDQAKQLPCMHLYHPNCILPWLGARNSCPVCRYELPTDDLEYEEEKCNAGRRTNHNYHGQNFNPESSSELSADTQELGSVGLEQQPDAESLLRASRTLGNPTVADLVEEIGTEGITNHEQEQEHIVSTECAVVQETSHEIADGVAESTRGAVSRTSGRCWFLFAAGPVLSVVGLVLVLCFRNRLTGASSQQNRRQVNRQQYHYSQDSQIQQVIGPNEVNNRRRWWRWWNPFGR